MVVFRVVIVPLKNRLATNIESISKKATFRSNLFFCDACVWVVCGWCVGGVWVVCGWCVVECVGGAWAVCVWWVGGVWVLCGGVLGWWVGGV